MVRGMADDTITVKRADLRRLVDRVSMVHTPRNQGPDEWHCPICFKVQSGSDGDQMHTRRCVWRQFERELKRCQTT